MPFGIIDARLKGDGLLPGSEYLIDDRRGAPGVEGEITQLKRVTYRVGLWDLAVHATSS